MKIPDNRPINNRILNKSFRFYPSLGIIVCKSLSTKDTYKGIFKVDTCKTKSFMPLASRFYSHFLEFPIKVHQASEIGRRILLCCGFRGQIHRAGKVMTTLDTGSQDLFHALFSISSYQWFHWFLPHRALKRSTTLDEERLPRIFHMISPSHLTAFFHQIDSVSLKFYKRRIVDDETG